LERPEEPIVVDLDANLEQDLRESRVSFRSIFKDDKYDEVDNFMLDEEIQDVCFNVYENVLMDLFSELAK